MKRAALSAESTNSTPPLCLGWLATMPTALPVDAREADDQLLGPARVDLQQRALVDERGDQRLACRTACSRRRGSARRSTTVAPARRRRRRGAAAPAAASCRAGRRGSAARRRCPPRRSCTSWWPQPGDAGVHARAAHLLERDLLADHHLGHARRAEVHRGVALAHDHHVAERRDVRAAGGARAEQHAHLRHDARQLAPGCGRCARRRGARGTSAPAR